MIEAGIIQSLILKTTGGFLGVRLGVSGRALGAAVGAGVYTDGLSTGLYFNFSGPSSGVASAVEAFASLLGANSNDILSQISGHDAVVGADVGLSIDASIFISLPEQGVGSSSLASPNLDTYVGYGTGGVTVHAPSHGGLNGAGITLHIGRQLGGAIKPNFSHQIPLIQNHLLTAKYNLRNLIASGLPEDTASLQIEPALVLSNTGDDFVPLTDSLSGKVHGEVELDRLITEFTDDFGIFGSKGFVEDKNRCFAAGTLVETPGGGQSRIEGLNLNDTVLAFSSVTGGLEPARVTQIHETPDQPVIDFHGTAVTPGHVYACPEGEYRQLGAVMMADGYVVAADGGIVRARTGEAVSPESFALRQAMFGPSAVPAFEGAVDRAGPDSPPPGAARIPSMAPDIHAGGPNGGNGGGAFATPATAFAAPPGAGGRSAPGAAAFDPWDYSRPGHYALSERRTGETLAV